MHKLNKNAMENLSVTVGIVCDELEIIKDNSLFDAVKQNNLNLAENKIKERVHDVNGKNIFGETPIFYAVCNNNLEMAKMLIKNGANLNMRSNNGSTLLFSSLKHKDNSMVKLLISSGANINIQENGMSLISFCILNNNVDVVKILLEKQNLNMNVQCENSGATPLIIAINLGNDYVAGELIRRGCNCNLDTFNGITPMLEAFYKKNWKVLKMLTMNRSRDNFIEKIFTERRLSYFYFFERMNEPEYIKITKEIYKMVEKEYARKNV